MGLVPFRSALPKLVNASPIWVQTVGDSLRPCLVVAVKILKWNFFTFEVLNID